MADLAITRLRDLGAIVRAAREARGLTHAELAGTCSAPQPRYGERVRGLRCSTSFGAREGRLRMTDEARRKVRRECQVTTGGAGRGLCPRRRRALGHPGPLGCGRRPGMGELTELDIGRKANNGSKRQGRQQHELRAARRFR
jgi:hypothetical protein